MQAINNNVNSKWRSKVKPGANKSRDQIY